MSTALASALRLSERSDQSALRERYLRTGRMQMPDFLSDESAMVLRTTLEHGTSWRSTYNEGHMQCERSAADMASLDRTARAALTRTIFARAENEFQYWFEHFPLFEAARAGERLSMQHNAVLNLVQSESFLATVRYVTGDDGIDFADVFLSRFGPGHFLRKHDDVRAKDKRRHAYVLSMTPRWAPDWGGDLLFFDEADNVVDGYAPAFNVLSIFRVPQEHAVSLVAPYAPAPRFAVTGWFRSR